MAYHPTFDDYFPRLARGHSERGERCPVETCVRNGGKTNHSGGNLKAWKEERGLPTTINDNR